MSRTGVTKGRQGDVSRHRFGWGRAGAAVVARPGLWGVAARQAVVLARPGWWRQWPPLPLPDPAYLRFRLQTAYGDPARPPAPADVVAYLEWCRDFRRLGYPSR